MTPKRIVLQGVAAAPGQAIGPAHRLVAHALEVPRRSIAPRKVAAEIRRFRQALSAARGEIRELRQRLATGGEDPGDQILASHLMILQDRELQREIVEAIKAERFHAPYVVRRVFQAKAHYLETLPSELFRSRAADIRDVRDRLVGQLLGRGRSSIAHVPEGSVLIASEIAPSEVASLRPERIAALVTQRGTLASHVTIMARSRGVPAVVGVGDALESVPSGEEVWVDGSSGQIVVGPNRADQRRHRHWREREARIGQWLTQRELGPGRTRDGHAIAVRANIDRPEDAALAAEVGAEGVGLFRTEFFFMDAAAFPDEETQAAAYAAVLDAFADAPVTIRTLDLGGDKHAALMGIPSEENPYLGLRGVRFTLEHPELYRTQLRAIVRAGAGRRVRILVPMIGSLDQFHQTRALLAEAREQIVAAGHAAAEIALGPMIELPSAVLMADRLAQASDFFSIGSNDLVQYLLGVDRNNARIASLFSPLDPAVLRAIALTLRHARPSAIPVGSCGEMSGELPGLLLLAGLGIDELSVAPFLVRRTKAILSQVRQRDLERMAGRCLEAEDRRAVRRIVGEELGADAQFRCEEIDGTLVCEWEPAEEPGARRT